MTPGAVWRTTYAGLGRGTSSVLQAWVCQRTSTRTVCANLVSITSLTSKRTTCLRSAWVVVFACQTAGRSCTKSIMPCRSASLTWLDAAGLRSEEHTSELQSRSDLVCRLLLEKKKNKHIAQVLYVHQQRPHTQL